MAERLPLSGTKRRVGQIVGLVLVGASMALLIRGLIARIDSGAGLSRSNARCEAAPGCDEAMARILVPGGVLLVLGAFVLARVEGRSVFSRRRTAADSTVRFTHRTFTKTTTRCRSTWDGPVHAEVVVEGAIPDRSTAIALIAAGAAVALVYAQLVL